MSRSNLADFWTLESYTKMRVRVTLAFEDCLGESWHHTETVDHGRTIDDANDWAEWMNDGHNSFYARKVKILLVELLEEEE